MCGDVLKPEEMKIIVHVWIPFKPPIKNSTELRVTINPPSPFSAFLKMISKESVIVLLPWAQGQISSPVLSTSLLFFSHSGLTLWKNKKKK